MWKVSWLYEKVHNVVNFGGYATILTHNITRKQVTIVTGWQNCVFIYIVSGMVIVKPLSYWKKIFEQSYLNQKGS